MPKGKYKMKRDEEIKKLRREAEKATETSATWKSRFDCERTNVKLLQRSEYQLRAKLSGARFINYFLGISVIALVMTLLFKHNVLW